MDFFFPFPFFTLDFKDVRLLLGLASGTMFQQLDVAPPSTVR